jgi:hypothetical protein
MPLPPQEVHDHPIEDPDQAGNVKEIPFHPPAKQLISKYAQQYSVWLYLQSQLIAYREDADMVLTKHVKFARYLDHFSRGSDKRDLLLFCFSALLGAGVQGFITELSTNPVRKLWVGVYSVVALLSLLAGAWQYIKR